MTLPALASPIAMIVFAFAMAYGGLVDLTTLKIHNNLVLGLLGAYVLLAPLIGLSIGEMGTSAAVAAGVLLVTFFCFSRGWMGGGDAKFAAVATLWLGIDQTPAFLVYTALFGGALTLAVLQLRMIALPAFAQGQQWIIRLQSDQAGIPYGVAMAAAALIVFPDTRWMTAIP